VNMLKLTLKQCLATVILVMVIFVIGCHKASSPEPALPIKVLESSKETANWEIKVLPDTSRNGYYAVQILYKGAVPPSMTYWSRYNQYVQNDRYGSSFSPK